MKVMVGWLVLFTGLVSACRGLYRFVKPLLYSGATAVGKEPLKKDSNIITDSFKETDQPVGDIYNTHFSQANGNLDEKI